MSNQQLQGVLCSTQSETERFEAPFDEALWKSLPARDSIAVTIEIDALAVNRHRIDRPTDDVKDLVPLSFDRGEYRISAIWQPRGTNDLHCSGD